MKSNFCNTSNGVKFNVIPENGGKIMVGDITLVVYNVLSGYVYLAPECYRPLTGLVDPCRGLDLCILTKAWIDKVLPDTILGMNTKKIVEPATAREAFNGHFRETFVPEYRRVDDTEFHLGWEWYVFDIRGYQNEYTGRMVYEARCRTHLLNKAFDQQDSNEIRTMNAAEVIARYRPVVKIDRMHFRNAVEKLVCVSTLTMTGFGEIDFDTPLFGIFCHMIDSSGAHRGPLLPSEAADKEDAEVIELRMSAVRYDKDSVSIVVDVLETGCVEKFVLNSVKLLFRTREEALSALYEARKAGSIPVSSLPSLDANTLKLIADNPSLLDLGR